MIRPRGRTDQGEATRAALFDAAIELMNEQGFEGTTLRQMAARAGVTHAVEEAKDRPRGERAAMLGRALDLLHLGVVLFWLLDASTEQKATSALLSVVSKALPLAQAALKLPGAWGLLGRLDAAVQQGLYRETA